MNRKMSGLSLLFINHIPFMYSISLRVRNGWFYSEKKKKKKTAGCAFMALQINVWLVVIGTSKIHNQQ